MFCFLDVPGTIQNSDKVMVELGTGYFAEKSIDEAKELIDRKLTLLAKSLESVETASLSFLYINDFLLGNYFFFF